MESVRIGAVVVAPQAQRMWFSWPGRVVAGGPICVVSGRPIAQ